MTLIPHLSSILVLVTLLDRTTFCQSPIVETVFEHLQVPPVPVPGTCERNACIASDPSFCSETLTGVYRILGQPCGAGQSCTDCLVVGNNGAVQCKCAQLPNRVPAQYGQWCGPTAECEVGECFRPCNTFFYLSDCPSERCSWDFPNHACIDKVNVLLPVKWNLMAPFGQLRPSESVRAKYIVEKTAQAVFPVSFDTLRYAIDGYLVSGTTPIEYVIPLVQFFSLLDINNSGGIAEDEFVGQLESAMISLEIIVAQRDGKTPTLLGGSRSSANPRSLIECVSNMSACNSTTPFSVEEHGAICQANNNMYYCPLTDSCTVDCGTNCGWLNTENFDSHRCVFPTLSNCLQIGKFFCAPDKVCLDDCTSCSQNYTVSDTVTHACRLPWWGDVISSEPSDWSCRYRKSSNQTCVSDMDCVYGQRSCVDSVCVPSESSCTSDRDCDYLAQFCDESSLICMEKFSDNGPTCVSDTQCGSFSSCNQAETPPVCRGLFSLPPNAISSSKDLCSSGSLLFNGTCSEFPTLSKRLGQ